MSEESSGTFLTRRQRYAVAVVGAVLIGGIAAQFVYGSVDGTDGTVAVIELDGSIDSDTAEAVEEELEEARANSSVDAVVLEVDSPGGTVGGSERLYLAVQRASEDMTVVSSVQEIGASGAYYAVLPTEEVYVHPSSIVGSVGVQGPQPAPIAPDESRSGPDKLQEGPEQTRETVDTLKTMFVDSVMEERSQELEVDRAEVSHAKTYPGVEAVDNGFADTVGSTRDAVEEAADGAGYDDYDIDTRTPTEDIGGLLQLEASEDGAVVVEESFAGYDGVETPMYFMVYGDVRREPEVVDAVGVERDGVTEDADGVTQEAEP